ncbi:hypothetical protein [Mailhella sp.]
MKNIADFIQSGLLAMLGGQNESLTLEDRNPNFRQGGQIPWGGGFDPLNGHENMLQKLPYIPSQQGSFGISPYEIDDLVDRPGQYLGPRESYVQLLSDKPQQAQGTLAEQPGQEPYYMVGRRPLNGLQYAYPNMPEAQDDVNSRFEHQHLWRNDGANFGLTNTGKFSEQGGSNGYSFDVPGHERTRYKAKYIEQAEKELDREWEEVERILRGAKENFPMSDDIDADMPRYHALRYNCQDYVDSVIERAWKKAKMNNDSLTF